MLGTKLLWPGASRMVKCFLSVSKYARPTSTVFPLSLSSWLVSKAQDRYLEQTKKKLLEDKFDQKWETRKIPRYGLISTLQLSDNLNPTQHTNRWFWNMSHNFLVLPLTMFPCSFPWLLSHTSLRFSCLPFLLDTCWRGKAQRVRGLMQFM